MGVHVAVPGPTTTKGKAHRSSPAKASSASVSTVPPVRRSAVRGLDGATSQALAVVPRLERQLRERALPQSSEFRVKRAEGDAPREAGSVARDRVSGSISPRRCWS